MHFLVLVPSLLLYLVIQSLLLHVLFMLFTELFLLFLFLRLLNFLLVLVHFFVHRFLPLKLLLHVHLLELLLHHQ